MINYAARLARALNEVFRRQAREVLRQSGSALLRGTRDIDLSHWDEVLRTAAAPALLHGYQNGMAQAALRIARARGEGRRETTGTREDQGQISQAAPAGHKAAQQTGPKATGRPLPTSVGGGTHAGRAGARPGGGGTGPGGFGTTDSQSRIGKGRRPFTLSRIVWGHTAKRLSRAVTKAVGFNFDLANPKIQQAVNQASMDFCAATNATASDDLNKTLAALRVALAKGLDEGEALTVLAQRVQALFTDPFRAWRIAATEAKRAASGGALLAAQDSGVVSGKRWLASSDACERCLALDGEERKLDEPFWVDPKGGPYAVCQYPPLHPFCMCDFTEILGDPGPTVITSPGGFYQPLSAFQTTGVQYSDFLRELMP